MRHRRAPALLLLAVACGPGGASGTSGTSGTSETSGASETSGTSGASGTSETSDTPTSSSAATTEPATTTDDVSTCPPPTSPCGGDLLLQTPELSEPSGLELCPDGRIHRYEPHACLHPFPVEPCTDADLCDGDACDALGDGACHAVSDQICQCRYPCATDADCGPEAACLCGSGVPLDPDVHDVYVPSTQCVPADCRSDADCGGFPCILSADICGYPSLRGLFCGTAMDECTTDADCDDPDIGDLCLFDREAARWRCAQQIPCE